MKRTGLVAALALGVGVALATSPSLAQPVPTTEAIIQGLQPPAAAPAEAEQGRAADFAAPGGQPPVGGRYYYPPPRPSIDLTVNFAFGSAELTTQAQAVLRNLGLALQDNRLALYAFEIGGHTDAVGSDAANWTLSERRAAAVRDFLVFYYQVAPKRLNARGFGESQLLVPYDPYSGANRRVQVTNVGGY